MKGQVEFVVILALIIIAISAIVLVSRQAIITPPTPPGPPQEMRTIKDSIINLVRAGIKDQLTLIYNQGGMLSPTKSVEFGMFDTQVWSECGETEIPDVSGQIGDGILAYLRQNLEDEMEFFGKNVKFDFSKKRYDVDIRKDEVNIRIYLPTEVEDYEIQQPYEVSVATKLYDVLDFSKNFVEDAAETRFFEGITIFSLVHANPEHENWPPLTGIQTGCGNVLFKSRSDILPGIKGVIKYTVDHVVWNTDALRLAENPFYEIHSVGGETYPGLRATFAYPPSWDSQISDYFMFAPEPLRVVPKPVMPMVPLCMAPYSVAYTFRYPVIVMVEDSLLNQWFSFAIMVDIQNSQLGDCTADFGEESEYFEICVNNANCDAKVTVKNSTGDPVEGADVSYYVCDIGLTDENGVVEGKIPCMVSELHVYREGYRSYGDLFRQDEIEDIEVSLKEISYDVTIHLKGLKAEASGGSRSEGKFDSYTLSGGPNDITDSSYFDDKELIVFMTFSPTQPNYFTGEDVSIMSINYDEEGYLTSELEIPSMQPVEYDFTASVSDNETGRPLGYINTSFELGEDENEIYVYLPVVLKVDGSDWEEDDPGVHPDEADQLTGIVTTYCGGSPPISTEETCV